MHSLAEQLETIGLMAAHESALAQLYRAYAVRFPRCETLFLRLAADEVEHARLISMFAAKVGSGEARVDPGRFGAPAVLSSLDLVRDRTEEAQREVISVTAALAAGLDLELGMIEKRFFDILEGDTPELTILLETLAEETRAHRTRLIEAPCQYEEDRDVGKAEP
jgi:rubrerythrin